MLNIMRKRSHRDAEKPTVYIGIRVFRKDKERWQDIISRSVQMKKRAKDVFHEMLNLYERQMLLWEK